MHLEIENFWRFLATEIEELEIQKYPGLQVGDFKIWRLANWKFEFLESGKWKFENFQVWRLEMWKCPSLEIGNMKILKYGN